MSRTTEASLTIYNEEWGASENSQKLYQKIILSTEVEYNLMIKTTERQYALDANWCIASPIAGIFLDISSAFHRYSEQWG